LTVDYLFTYESLTSCCWSLLRLSLIVSLLSFFFLIVLLQDPSNPRLPLIRQTYIEMHTKQTLAYVLEQKKNWLAFNKKKMTIMDALLELNKLVDDSDPDVCVANFNETRVFMCE
jgi:hypothetical protein